MKRDVFLLIPQPAEELYEFRLCRSPGELDGLPRMKCGVSITWDELQKEDPLPFSLLRSFGFLPKDFEDPNSYYAKELKRRRELFPDLTWADILEGANLLRSIPKERARQDDLLVVILELKDSHPDFAALQGATLKELERMCQTCDIA